MDKLIELGVVSKDTHATEPGVNPDGPPLPSGPGKCLIVKYLDLVNGTPAEEVDC